MLLDKLTTLAEKFAITTGTLTPKQFIDLGVAGTMSNGQKALLDPGRGGHGEVLAQVTKTLAGGTSLKAQLVMSNTVDANGLSGTVTVIQETGAVPTAQLKAGYMFQLGKLPPGITQRYLGIRFVAVGTYTTGEVEAGLTWGKDTNRDI